jgi:hypothetical protein
MNTFLPLCAAGVAPSKRAAAVTIAASVDLITTAPSGNGDEHLEAAIRHGIG